MSDDRTDRKRRLQRISTRGLVVETLTVGAVRRAVQSVVDALVPIDSGVVRVHESHKEHASSNHKEHLNHLQNLPPDPPSPQTSGDAIDALEAKGRR